MESGELSREARAASWRVFALVLLSASYFFQSSGHNEAARFDQMRTVTEHGEWWIDRFAYNTADTFVKDGHTYPNKAPGSALLGLLPWVALRGAAGLLPIDEGKQLILITWALTILFSALPTAATCLLFLRFLARSGWSDRHATIASLGYGLGTIAFPFATLFFGHQLAAGFAFAAFYGVWRARSLSGSARRLHLLAAGLFLGFLPVIEYTGAIASFWIVIYALAAVGLRETVAVVAAAAVAAAPLPLYNLLVLGHAETLSYSFYAKEGSAFPGHRAGFMGVSWPRFEVLKEITFRPRRGLFYANPWLALMFAAPFIRSRVRAIRLEFAFCVAIVMSFLAFNAGFGDSIVYWGGAFSFGPRHMLIAIPFFAILASFALGPRVLTVCATALIAVTALLMMTAAAIDPRLPYEPADPYFAFYLPLFSRGLFAGYPWSTFGDGVIFDSTGAFNVGRIFLARDFEMLPLGVIWAAGLFAIIRAGSLGRQFARGAVAAACLALCLWPAARRLTPEQPGLCEVISRGRMWPYFADNALQPEPSTPLTKTIVPSPAIPSGAEAAGANGRPTSIAVTFSGFYTAPSQGWRSFQLDVEGQAALYIDGARKLMRDSSKADEKRAPINVYLSAGPHELIVRYMTDHPSRHLGIFTGYVDEPLTELVQGLTTRGCR